ncbi:hypothetical protein SAMN05660662_0490 [Blastococcus aurantiacus]|uniref:Uncharacterized protein n=1 Tax=Blastococcus aurantiacus TaxID=1550231 RepID=A0A1G7HBE4_9ACTN|nr:hypothetical protein [Blastococcus aurantiacus]SDE97633.1 hypothetical protein SAMN05660662_0490 [Blastococcus aurantiacus]
MTDPTERQLRELFAADAAGAPDASGLTALALHTARRRRRARAAAAAGLIAAVVVVGGGTVAAWDPGGAAGSADSDAAAPTGVGALAGDAAADCAGGYSTVGLSADLTREGAFALDGTVAEIEPGPDLGPEMPRQYATVRFRVHTWYHGGSGGTVDVLLDPPDIGSQTSDVKSYGVGTRLLVSGLLTSTERASGAMTVDGDEAYFGFSCGATRYHDEATAAEWAAVVAGELPTGPLPATGAESCTGYSPALVGQQDVALDGTVIEIGEQRFPRLPGETEADGYFSVTFQVHGWYRGGPGETVTLHMESPYLTTPEGDSIETYTIGTRLLVAGRLSDVAGRGLIAQSCGFTRYYDEATATEWAAATD